MTYIPSETGDWINEDFARLAEVIKDYDPHLELRWIPPDKRTDVDTSRPYCVVDTRTNYIIFYASELDTPEEILTKLWTGDNTKGNLNHKLDAFEAAQRTMKLKREIDKREELMDQVEWLIGTKRNFIKFNGKKFDDQLRRIE